MTLRRQKEREAAVRDVPEDSSVLSHLASAREGRESFAINVRHNATQHVVGQQNCDAFLGRLGGLSVCGVDEAAGTKI